MFKLALIYQENNKKYTIPFSLVEKVLEPDDVERLKLAALKEVSKGA